MKTGSAQRYRFVHVSMIAAVLSVGAMALTACQGDPDIDINAFVATAEPPDVLYNQGLANLDAGRYTEATRKFDAVDKQHPYSEYARRAVVMKAFVSYRRRQYDDAISSAQRYLSLYPGDEEAAYAQYIIGLSHFRRIKDVTRDQRDAVRAIQAMNEVVERYPDSEYVVDAQDKIRYARDQLAGKEMQVGRYYLERREYIGAVSRFRNVVENFSNTRHVEEALARLVEAYYAMGITNEAQTAAAVLGHNYPDSQWYADSYKLLRSGGLEPRENRGSWIAAAGKAIVGG